MNNSFLLLTLFLTIWPRTRYFLMKQSRFFHFGCNLTIFYLLIDRLSDVDFNKRRFTCIRMRRRYHSSQLIFNSVKFVINFNQFNLFVFLLTHLDYITLVKRLLTIFSHSLKTQSKNEPLYRKEGIVNQKH